MGFRMRSVALPLAALLSLFSMTAQENTTPTAILIRSQQIPVELKKSINADRSRPGNPVHFRLAEGILTGSATVIPRKARLYGHVLIAEAARDGKPSMLSIVIDRAEWDGQVLPLHAFVTGWGKRRAFEYPPNRCPLNAAPQIPGRGDSLRKGSAGNVGNWGNTFDLCKPLPPFVERYEPAHPGHKILMSQIKFYQNSTDSSTIMASEKNIRLPSGLLLIFQNVDPPELDALKK